MKKIKRNKGEMTEIYAVLKLIRQRLVNYGDEQGLAGKDSIHIIKILNGKTTIKLDDFKISIEFMNEETHTYETLFIPIESIISEQKLLDLLQAIKSPSTTFNLPCIDKAVEQLKFHKTKGTSFEKGDIGLDFVENGECFERQEIGIKSFLGGLPKLLNASQATNFIYKVENISSDLMNDINAIEGNSKIIDRIKAIKMYGGVFRFHACENSIYESTLRKVDTQMPQIVAAMLLSFFSKEMGNNVSLFSKSDDNIYGNADEIECRIRDFIKYSMLGIFPTKSWDGNIKANGAIVVNDNGELVFFHTNRDKILKEYFYRHAILDTPSSTRHRFGTLYSEKGKLFFKLNLQLRLKK